MRPLSELSPGRLTLLSGCMGSGKTSLCYGWAQQTFACGEPVLWLDGDQNCSHIKLTKGSNYNDYFWGYRPQTPQQAFDLALAFLRLQAGGLIVLDSLDGLLPSSGDQRTWTKRFMPRLIGTLHLSGSRFLCTVQATPHGDRNGLRVYAYQQIELGDSHDIY